jgi:hypothetical protein
VLRRSIGSLLGEMLIYSARFRIFQYNIGPEAFRKGGGSLIRKRTLSN